MSLSVKTNAVRNENQKHKSGSKAWWSNVNKITGTKDNKIPVTSFIDPNEINSFFHNLCTDSCYISSEVLQIPDGTRVPLLTVEVVFKFLQEQKCSSSGPDDLPHWFWREFATEIAPTITKIFKLSLKTGKIPVSEDETTINTVEIFVILFSNTF